MRTDYEIIKYYWPLIGNPGLIIPRIALLVEVQPNWIVIISELDYLLPSLVLTTLPAEMIQSEATNPRVPMGEALARCLQSWHLSSKLLSISECAQYAKFRSLLNVFPIPEDKYACWQRGCTALGPREQDQEWEEEAVTECAKVHGVTFNIN